MATRKTPPTRKAGAARTGAAKSSAAKSSAAKSSAAKSGATKSSAAKSGATKSSAAKTGGSRPASKAAARPAGRGPAQRPPARRKGKSIVNQRQTPWGLIASAAAVVVFAVVIAVVVIVKDSGSGSSGGQIIPNTPTGATTVQKTVKRIKNTTGINGVIAYDTQGWPGNGKSHAGAMEHQHVTGPVDYSITPPAGGPHNATWMNAGVYTKPVPSERAVHNLEHGAVWITYDPHLAASKVKQLRAFVAKQSLITESFQATGIHGQANRYMDLSPWASNTLPSPIVMSSWGFQLRLTSPTDPRMQRFVDMFRNSSKYSPEYRNAVDGVPVGTGGRPAYDGSKKANPSGSGAGGGA